MRSVLEEVPRSPGSSFRILVDPDLRDFYYWHFHPEIEIVYIHGVDGMRHIGGHKSEYRNGDLAMIGSYIPHLNFDYGVKGRYEKTVLQMDDKFLLSSSDITPELDAIRQLFLDAKHGLIFDEKKKKEAGPLIRKLPNFQGFQRFHRVLEILSILAVPASYTLLHKNPYEGSYYMKQREKFRTITYYIEGHYHRKIKLEEVARLSNYSLSAFCRYFKKMTKLSFTDFLNNYRVDMAKQLLKKGASVSEAAYGTGFESLSYFNRVFKKVTLMSPSSFRKSL